MLTSKWYENVIICDIFMTSVPDLLRYEPIGFEYMYNYIKLLL